MLHPFVLELSGRLENAQSEEEIHDAYRGALAAFDDLNEQAIAAAGAKPDCCAGCSFCCWLRVDVHAHEIFLIARHIRSHFPEDELRALLGRLREHSAKVLPLTTFEHATQNIVCPLLQDGRCSVYTVRPMSCRRHHSEDVKTCQYAFEHPTDLEYPSARNRTVAQTLTRAMADATSVYAQLALDTTIYELGTALEEALVDEESWRGWLQHMEAFAVASVTPRA